MLFLCKRIVLTADFVSKSSSLFALVEVEVKGPHMGNQTVRAVEASSSSPSASEGW